MAHELTITNGKAEMAFVGETPWHGLGQQLEEDASIGAWQDAAGMDWVIKSSPVQYTSADANLQHGFFKTFEGQNVLYRSDNNMPLAVVSDRYKPVQPREVLEFFRDLVAENGFKIHTAGTLRGGKRMWALAETGKFGEVCKDDGVGGFLLLSTSCDRTLATTARFTTVRVVCNNTLTVAVNDDAHKVSFSHIQHFNHEVVKAKLCSAVESFGAFMDMAKVLQKQKLNVASANQFVAQLVAPMSQVKEGDITENRAYKKIMALFEGEARGQELVGHSKWGMLNAVTEYVDHYNPSRNQDARLDSAWFGNGDRLKTRALELLAA
jgi:phage/plasmid-like protein (TIGR03299 family)